MLNKILLLSLLALATAAPVEVAERDALAVEQRQVDPVQSLLSSIKAAAPEASPVPPPFPDPQTDPEGFLAWLVKTYPTGYSFPQPAPGPTAIPGFPIKRQIDPEALISSIKAGSPEPSPAPLPFPDPSKDPQGFLDWLLKTFPTGYSFPQPPVPTAVPSFLNIPPAPSGHPAQVPNRPDDDAGHPAQIPKRPQESGAHPAQIPHRPQEERQEHPAQIPKRPQESGAHPAQIPHRPHKDGEHPAQIPHRPTEEGAHPAQIPHRPQDGDATA
ncbi:hypothetical protein Q8F55_002029 [Vanrija albida]|uniref:Uncharacterized protein n=1 Tax=Vanrija albida TaxID=181172 RepID=A0ABR3Q8V9_9TREE